MKKKEQSIKYTYYYWDKENKKEIPFTITVGDEGVTEEHILWLEEFDHEEKLQERYIDENRDYTTENKKRRFSRRDEGVSEDPIDELATNEMNPDVLFYEEEGIDPQVEQLLQFMQKLTPTQIDLIYDHYGARRYLADIATEENCSPQAVTNRKNKIISRLKKLFSELDK